jgi:hypothetical protein
MGLFSLTQSLIRYAVISVVVLLCAFLLLLPAIRNTASNYNEKSLGKKAMINFQVPSPGKQQVAELAQQSFIDDAFPYYDAFSTVQLPRGRKLSNYYIMLIEDGARFPFTQTSLQVTKANTADSPAAYADYAFAKEYGVKKGDTLSIELGAEVLSVPVTAIIENCASMTHYQQDGSDGSLIVSIPQSLINSLGTARGKPVLYSGAYIRANNQAQAKAYLKDYKPLGRQREADVFKSDADYSAYLKDFNNTSYEAEIRDFSMPNQFAAQNGGSLKNALLILIIISVAIMLSAFVRFSNPKTKNAVDMRIHNGGKATAVSGSVRGSVVLEVLWSAVLLTILAYVFLSSGKVYCPAASYFLPIGISLGGIVIFGFIFANIYSQQYIK